MRCDSKRFAPKSGWNFGLASKFRQPAESQIFPDPRQPGPSHHQCPTSRGSPPLFEIAVALRPQADSIVMAEPALQRLEQRPVQLTPAVVEEVAAPPRVLLQRRQSLTSLECWRQDTKGSLRRYLQHHALAITRIQCTDGLLHSPPARPRAIGQAHSAPARLRSRVLLRQRLLAPLFRSRHGWPALVYHPGIPLSAVCVTSGELAPVCAAGPMQPAMGEYRVTQELQRERMRNYL